MWPFQTSIVDPGVVDWQIDVFEWLIGAIERPISATTLVAPGLNHFTFDGEKGQAFAQRVFDQVRSYAAIDPSSRIRLIPQPKRRPDTIGESAALIVKKHDPLGTFRVAADGVSEITYDPGLVRDPENLIATFAHEVAHHLVPSRKDAPIDEDEYEILIDLCVAFLGFGVFLANTRAERVVEGAWAKWRGGGYLPINDRVMATALFLEIKNDMNDRRIARDFLRPHLRNTFDKAFRQLKRHQPAIEHLRRLDATVRRRPISTPASPQEAVTGLSSVLGLGLPVVPQSRERGWPASGTPWRITVRARGEKDEARRT